MFQCPSCGGHVVFDIYSQKCKCEHCGSYVDPSAYQSDAVAAEERTQYGATVYVCSQCGAELISLDQEAVGTCSYCGASGVLESRMSAETRPGWIIPFKVPKDQCKAEYAKLIKGAPYAPREFRSPDYIDNFRGIYIPYWMYAVDFLPSITLTADKSYSTGSYTYQEVHTVNVDLNGLYRGIPYDASSAFDDSIAETIAPYHQEDIVSFEPGYLAGFYADTADVPDVTYVNDASTRATRHILSEIVEFYQKRHKMKIRRPTTAAAKEMLQTKCVGRETTLFPVWFLTWRKRDRVAYVVMNGETGRISADLPVDTKRFLLFSGILAGIIFLFMTMFVSMAAPTALFFSSVLAVAASGLFLSETLAIHDRENHIFDRGYFVRGDSHVIKPETAEKIRLKREKKRDSKDSGGKSMGSWLLDHITTFVVLLAVFFSPLIAIVAVIITSVNDAMPADRAIMGCLITAIIGVILFLRLLPLLPHVKKNTLLQALPAFLAELAAFWIAATKPVQDIYYYYGCIFCLIGIMVTCFSLISKYNLMATRPIPTFFNRGEGGNRHE